MCYGEVLGRVAARVCVEGGATMAKSTKSTKKVVASTAKPAAKMTAKPLAKPVGKTGAGIRNRYLP